VNAELPSARDSQPKSREWYARQKSRERIRLIGLLVIAPLILLLGSLRFGRTISWGAR
jgi:hypothetical protein